MEARRLALEEQARSIEKTISSKSSNHAALEATIKSAELYFQALRLTDKPSDRKRIDSRCKELLAQAENLKGSQEASSRPAARKLALKVPSSTRKLTTRENIIILEGSKLHGFVFKPWVDVPASDEFNLSDGEIPFTDVTPLPLSLGQLESFDGWKRPQDALASLKVSPTGEPLPAEAVMHIPEEMDLVQDMTSDCSVVASLCAGTSRVERGHPKVRVFPTALGLLTCHLDSSIHCIPL
jgi:calpain-7